MNQIGINSAHPFHTRTTAETVYTWRLIVITMKSRMSRSEEVSQQLFVLSSSLPEESDNDTSLPHPKYTDTRALE